MPSEGSVYRVEQAMNDQRAMVLEAVDGGATVHAVQYATPSVRDRLAALSAGDTARLRVTRVGCRADVWRVDRTYPGVSTDWGAETVTATESGTGRGTERRRIADDADDSRVHVPPPDAV